MCAVGRILVGITGGTAAYKACDGAGEPMVPPRTPSFLACNPERLYGSRRAKPGSAGGIALSVGWSAG